MKKVAPLLILVVACGCDRDAVSRRSANTEKADASGLPTIVVKGELTGTYSKALFRNGVPYRREECATKTSSP